MSSPSKVYPLTDPAALALKIQEGGGPNIDPTIPSGVVSAHGVTLGWLTDPAAKTITITIIHSGWIPADAIWSHVDRAMGT